MYSKWFFDKADRDLLHMVNATLDHGSDSSAYNPNLHPHGILELATTHEFRVAHAVIDLLGKLEAGQAKERLTALRTLHDEVLHSARTPFRYNTGRVLVQIMKEIIRSRQDEDAQLRLMHDFRKAASGNPRIVRHFLARHHLLEMPEEWNQLTMDHHVHDANTKGRKNPTHLLMDAWIKGIRYLTIIYYNFIEPEAARELLRAAEILGVTVRVGIEFQTVFRNRFVNFVWAPRGFSDAEAFLAFLEEKPTKALMDAGRDATAWTERQILRGLDRWNAEHRVHLMRTLDLDLPPISHEAFLAYVHPGQASTLHLAEMIHRTYLPLLKSRAAELLKEARTATPERLESINTLLDYMEAFLPENLQQTWLSAEKTPELACLAAPCPEVKLPEIMRMPPPVLLDWLGALRSGYRITLQLASLTPEDVLELLWDCQGLITHLELFNLKEWQEGHLTHLKTINELQRSINNGSVLHLKRTIRNMLHQMDHATSAEERERRDKFQTILRHIPELQHPYRVAPLRSRIGTDSTSNSSVRHGMGLAVLETLPKRTRRAVHSKRNAYQPIFVPIRITLSLRQIWSEPSRFSSPVKRLANWLHKLPGCGRFGLSSRIEWFSTLVTVQRRASNIITMGGSSAASCNHLRDVKPQAEQPRKRWPGLAYLNSRVSDWLKVLAGFIPAQLAFMLTQDWWVLAWFGALIWYLITGLRNIPQAIYAGGGALWRSSVLHWNNYVSWSRICDSLLYTGISVLLLEWGIRVLLLEELLALTVVNSPTTVFVVIALANGFYIAWHNAYRGFPRSAVIGNLFRSVLAIPLSLIYFEGLCQLAELWGSADPAGALQPSAAIISKTASDTVACIIEGIADRRNNHRLRLWDYSTKLGHMFNGYAEMELRFPDHDMLTLLERPREFCKLLNEKAPDILRDCIINALDLLYFWMHQPCAQQTLSSLVRSMTPEECALLVRSQRILLQTREVSQLLVNGLLGDNFGRALSFYLSYHERYILQVNQLCLQTRKIPHSMLTITVPAELSQEGFKSWSQ